MNTVSLPLKWVVKDVADTFKDAQKIWFFGSRRHGDATGASDIDVIVESASDNIPERIGEILEKYEGYIDLFVLYGNRATSVRNGNYFEAQSARFLLETVGATLVWERDTGWIMDKEEFPLTIDKSKRPVYTNPKKLNREADSGRFVPMR